MKEKRISIEQKIELVKLHDKTIIKGAQCNLEFNPHFALGDGLTLSFYQYEGKEIVGSEYFRTFETAKQALKELAK